MPVTPVLAPVPRTTAVVQPPRSRDDDNAWQLGDVWGEYFDRFIDTLNAKPTLMGSVALEEQQASISATQIPAGDNSAGQYLVSYFLAVTRAASTSSSVQIALTFTHNGVTKTETFTALTGNTTSTHQSYTKFVRVDRGTVVQYAITYSSTGSTAMQYSLDIAVIYVRA